MADLSVVSSLNEDEPLGEYRRRQETVARAPSAVRKRRRSNGRANGRSDGSPRADTQASVEHSSSLDEVEGPMGDASPWMQRLGKAANQWGWPAVLGAVAGCASLPGGAFPLASGYVVALAALGDYRRALMAGVASLGAMGLAIGGMRWAEQVLILLMTWMLVTVLSPPAPGKTGQRATARTGDRTDADRPGVRRPAIADELNLGPVRWNLPFYVFGGTILLRVGMLYVARAGGEAMAWATAESLLELGAALILIPAVSLHRRLPARLQGPHLAGLTLALAGLAWALAPLDAAELSAGHIVALLGILWLALGGGAGYAAPAGAALGALLAAAGAGIETVGLWALAGLGAGLARPWGKPGVVSGLVASQLLLSLFGLRLEELYPGLIQAVAAAGLFAFTPQRVLRRWLDWVGVAEAAAGRPSAAGADDQTTAQTPDVPVPGRASGTYLRRLSYILDELATAFADAAAVGGTDGASGGRPEARVTRAVAAAGDGTADAAAGAAGEDEAEEATSLFVEGIHERICQGCSSYRFCWEENLHHTYRDVVEVAATADRESKLSVDDFPEGLRQRCIQPRNLLRASAETFKLVRLHQSWEGRYSQSIEFVPQQLRGLAHVVRQMAGRLESGETDWGKGWPGSGSREYARDPDAPTSAERQGVMSLAGGETVWTRVNTAIVRRAKDGSSVSGDSDGRIDLGSDRIGLVLSDGMGAGEPAARESRAVVRLLRRLLEAGFEPTFAIQLINSVLLLRSPEETFATIDLAVLDLRRRTVEFTKVGAAPAFIVRRRGSDPAAEAGAVEVVRGSEVPPAGILQQLDAQTVRRKLEPGDLLVMITDGILDAWVGRADGKAPHDDAEAQVAAWLSEIRDAAPAEAAKRLLGHVMNQVAKDDMTVLVARLDTSPSPAVPPKDVGVYRRRRAD